jgi:large subunit ribosomal protein L25
MTVSLSVEPRVKGLSSNSKSVTHIAGVVYGPKFVSTKVQIDKKEFEKTFKQAGESTVVELTGLEKPVSVLIKEVIFSPIKGGIMHVDFYAPEMGKEITTHVALHFINEAPAVKNGAVVDKVMHELMVTGKPDALPSHIDVDLGLLVEAGAKIHVSDLALPKGLTLKSEATEVVAVAEAGRIEVAEPVAEVAEEVAEEPKAAE